MIAVNTFLKTLTLLFLAFGPQNAVFQRKKTLGTIGTNGAGLIGTGWLPASLGRRT